MRARILTIALFFLFCGAALFAAKQTGGEKKSEATPQKDPEITASTVINGKTLDQWIALIHGKDRSLTEVALQSILRYPAEVAKRAVPVMVAELKKHTPNTPIDMSVRTDIPSPLAVIVVSQKNPDPTEVSETVAILKKMAKDPQVIVKIRSIQALGVMGTLAKDTLPELVNVVKEFNSPAWELRGAAVQALARVGWVEKGPAQIEVVKALFYVLSKDSAFKNRVVALDALRSLRVGETPQYKAEYLAELKTMAAKDVDPLCRLQAHAWVFPLLEKADDKKQRADSVALFLDNSDHVLRIEAAKILGSFGPEAAKEVPRLHKVVKDNKTKDLELMGWAMWALGQMGPAGGPALEDLKKIAEDPAIPDLIRETARIAIDGIQGVATQKKEDPKKGGHHR